MTKTKAKKTTKKTKKSQPKALEPAKKSVKKPVRKTSAKKPQRPKESESRLQTQKVETSELQEKKRKYLETVGRRKTAVARVRLFTSSPSESAMEGNLIINDKLYKEFFPELELQQIVESPLKRLKSLNRFQAIIKVKGGGTKGQAEAIRHGLARALVLFDPNFRKKLKKVGFLTRDPRKKERKKYGLKKARRAPQWRKR